MTWNALVESYLKRLPVSSCPTSIAIIYCMNILLFGLYKRNEDNNCNRH
jgi:hypothetical protein